VQVTCGIDWAQDHHDSALVAADGAVVAQRRIGNDAAGFAELLAVLAEHDTPSSEHGDQARNRQILWIAGEGMITRRPW
jgi:transposase